jgi:hydroxyacylglutathione hydrolase
MVEKQPSRPANMRNIVAINQGLRPLTWEPPGCPRLLPEAAEEYLREGGTILDTRSPADFGQGHIAGAVNVQLSSAEFEQRVGWILAEDTGMVLVADDLEAARAAAFKLAFVGLDQRVRGVVSLKAWRAAGLPVVRLEQISIEELRQGVESGSLRVLDVRESSEWAEGHIASAHHMSFKQLPQRMRELPFRPEERIAVICATGMRSSTACSILLPGGFARVLNVEGGMAAWKKAGFPAAR